MLQLALKSGVPIITCTTTDTVNASAIISYLAGEDVDELADFEVGEVAKSKFTYLMVLPLSEYAGTFEELYSTLVDEGKTLIFVNTEYDSSLFLDCHSVPVPPEMLRDTLADTVPAASIDTVLKTLGGLDLKTVGEVIRITNTRDGKVDVKGLLETRKLIAPSISGLTQVGTDMPYYKPQLSIDTFLEDNLRYINNDDVDPRLRPRGLMFTGQSGTGKTQGAKYIAATLGLPLYLIDLAGLLTRWHGESETNLRHALNTVDQESPCIVLMDEIEKAFSNSDEGTTNRLLSVLLWWMQERKSKAIVIMTCNDLSRLPVELYRSGRIDRSIEFTGIATKKEAEEFIKELLETYTEIKTPTLTVVKKELTRLYKESGEIDFVPVSHADLAQLTIDLIKTANK